MVPMKRAYTAVPTEAEAAKVSGNVLLFSRKTFHVNVISKLKEYLNLFRNSLMPVSLKKNRRLCAKQLLEIIASTIELFSRKCLQ